jgi:hypothetical protein
METLTGFEVPVRVHSLSNLLILFILQITSQMIEVSAFFRASQGNALKILETYYFYTYESESGFVEY